MDFKPIKDNKIYEKIIEEIKNLIFEGKIKKGDRLPSERSLKKQLNISRASIREAFSALEMIGLIESRTGGGTFIKSSLNRNILEPLSLMLLLEDNIVEELLELRRVLEVDCARLAAERSNDSELEEMTKHIKDLAESSGFEEKSIRADREFHYTIARASKNNVLYNVMISISEAMDYHITNTRTKLVSKKSTMENFVWQHRDIFKAIKSRKPEKAMEAMQNHLYYVEKLIKREIKG